MRKVYFILIVLLTTGICHTANAQSYLTVDPDVQSVDPNGGTAFIATITSNVDWEITTINSWIVIITPTTGSGDMSFTYDIEENTSSSTRTGTITVSSTDGSGLSDEITIVQAGQSDSYMNLDPSAQSVVPDGGNFTGNITSNVDWQVVASESAERSTSSARLGLSVKL